MGQQYPDWEDGQYVQHLKMTRDTFWRLYCKYGHLLEQQVICLRLPVASEKRLAISLHFLTQGLLLAQLSLMYGVGKTTAVNTVHDTVNKLYDPLVKESIQFPKGRELEQLFADFEHLSGLPQCALAVDGPFMGIRKPVVHGATFWCYKQFTAILVLASVDAPGVFSYVNAGNPGSRGDAAVFDTTRLFDKVKRRSSLGTNGAYISRMEVLQNLVGNSAFSLSPSSMKCCNEGQTEPHQFTFNYRLIRIRQVVEQAFGRFNGRFQIITSNNISVPTSASKIATVCCALHNICERWSCAFDQSWLIEPHLFEQCHPAANAHNNTQEDEAGIAVRNTLSTHLHNVLPIT